jgi:hypothetical protein
MTLSFLGWMVGMLVGTMWVLGMMLLVSYQPLMF